MNQFPLGPLSIPFQKVKKIREGIQNFVYIASVVDILAVQKHYMSVNSNLLASQQNMKKLRWCRLHRALTLTFEYIRELLYKFKIQ
jgi:hypothetical protein